MKRLGPSATLHVQRRSKDGDPGGRLGGKWFTIIARVCPNKLTFHGVRLDGYDTEETRSVKVSLALPRDGGLTPYVLTRLVVLLVLYAYSPMALSLGFVVVTTKVLLGPSSSAHASFAGPVDLDTFHIKEDVWPKTLIKTSVFVKLGSYLMPEDDRPPHKGVHICHVLLLFPIEQQPWSSLLGWMYQQANPFPKGSAD